MSKSGITGKFFNFIVSLLELVSVMMFVPVLIASFVYGWKTNGFFYGLGSAITIVVVFGILFLTIENGRTLKGIRDLLAKRKE